MSAIGPGDWVECVDGSPGVGFQWARDDFLTVGAIYCVADTFTLPEGEAVVSLIGHERHAASAEHGFRVGYGLRRFRPIYRPRADLIESLKTPAKREGVPVDA